MCLTKRIYRDGTVKPATIEDVRNRIATARAWGDVVARDVLNDHRISAVASIENTLAYWQEAKDLLQSYLEAHNENQPKGT